MIDISGMDPFDALLIGYFIGCAVVFLIMGFIE